MRELVSKLWDIFKKDPLGIVSVLTMDIAGIVFLSLNPFVIGSCIDGFFEHNYFWFYILIVLQCLFIAVRAAITSEEKARKTGAGVVKWKVWNTST